MEIADIIKIAENAEDMTAEIAEMEQALKARKAELQKIMMEELPSLMMEESLQEFKLESGAMVKIKNIVSGSLPAPGTIEKAKGDDKKELIARLKEGLAWLRKNKAGDLIKNQVSVLLPAGADKVAQEAAAALRKLKLSPVRTMTIHPQSLNGYLREAIANGKDIPQKTFSLFIGQIAEIELPKAEKAQKGSRA
jgi:hypothetical protein